jgi:FdhD protein
MPDSITPVRIVHVAGTGREARQDQLAVEEPLELRLRHFDGVTMREQALAITMRTPGDDLDLARGFLVGEGVVGKPQDIQSCRHSGSQALKQDASNVVSVTLSRECRVDVGKLERHFYTTSSCGVCGKSSLEALELNGARPLTDNAFQISAAALYSLGERLAQNQVIFGATGGLHAAALFDERGEFSTVREDVGRHNALDKVIGSLLESGALPAAANGVFVSGRASFELLQKSVMAGIPLLCAVGAPSSLAVDLAREYDMTLIGFLRGERFNIYAGEQRVRL